MDIRRQRDEAGRHENGRLRHGIPHYSDAEMPVRVKMRNREEFAWGEVFVKKKKENASGYLGQDEVISGDGRDLFGPVFRTAKRALDTYAASTNIGGQPELTSNSSLSH